MCTKIFVFAMLVCGFVASAQEHSAVIGSVLTAQQTSVHDPVMIKQGDKYYLFCTGAGISVFSSTDLKNWRKEKPVFETPPEWAVEAVPGFKGHIWAPDISCHYGKYYLYYAVSTFGKNGSCIGVAVNKTLDPLSPDYKWEDHGKLIQSVPGRDMWNAIDPNLILDDDEVGWLSFGSFWNGIKLVKLRPDFLTIAEPQEWAAIASRPRSFEWPDTVAGNAAIEAPFMFKKNSYYYLFVSWDYCCRGEKSDYKVVVGRSKSIKGPYLDKSNMPLNKGGGTLVVQGDQKKWFGAGHNAVCDFDGQDYIIYHGYDANDRGKPKLIIDSLQWDKGGWPFIFNEVK